MLRRTFILLTLLQLTGAAVFATPAWEAARAILHERCTKCHGGVKHKGGLDLRAIPNILKGGESGPAVLEGKPEESLLIEVLDPEADVSMPPKGEPLSASEIETLTAWVRSLGQPSPIQDTATIPEGLSPTTVIDFLTAKGWQQRQVKASALVDDAGYVRRAYLTLTGRIPTSGERERFLDSTDSQKRAHLVDVLLEGSEFARHFAEIFDTVMMGRRHGLTGKARPLQREADWHTYLRDVFAQNRPWNQVAREMLESKGAARWYLAAHRNNHEDMVRSVAPALLGKQIACAQCHNHPIVPEIEQRHYWGLVAFFNRSFNVQTPQGLQVGESAVGGNVKFSSLEGESYEAKLAFFTGKTVEETSTANEDAHDASHYRIPPNADYFEKLKTKKPKDKKGRGKDTPKMDQAPVPLFSRRAALAEVAIEGYPDFAKAYVNRIWAILLGRGLVHPVDHLDSMHPPSHPELLDWLGRDFEKSGYDTKQLIRAITASRVSQLSSVPLESTQRPPEESFASRVITPLSAEALFRSMLVAGGHTPDAEGKFPGIDEQKYRDTFARLYPDLFPETYSPQASEGMFFTNNVLMNEILVESFEDLPPSAIVNKAFFQAYGRPPDEDERAASAAYLGENPSTKRAQSLLWALINSAEFRFIH